MTRDPAMTAGMTVTRDMTERARRPIRCKQDGLSNTDTVAYVPYSDEWVRKRWKEYQDDGEHAEVVGRVEEAIA